MSEGRDDRLECIEVGNTYSEYRCRYCTAKFVVDDDAGAVWPYHECLPMVAKFAAESDFIERVTNLLEWLQEKKRLRLTELRNGDDPIYYGPDSTEAFIFEWVGIDRKQLEKERKRILEIQSGKG